MENDTLSWHFDTGATGTELYSRYFDKYRAEILRTGTRETIQAGGAGGIIDREVYIIPRVSLRIGDKVAVLDNVAVHTRPPFAGLKYYGNLGQDDIQQFREMDLDFDNMSLGFR